jgi:biotin-(acetyl-CoA carboxylase) ligase
VKASCGNEKWEGTATGITESGALLLQTEDGKEHILHAGELSIRLEDGRYA